MRRSFPWVWLDGRWIRTGAPAVPIEAPALLRGEGLFETIACEGGRPILFHYHCDRLEASARALGLRLRYGRRELEAIVARALARNRAAEANVRLMLLRGVRRDAVAVLLRPLARPPAEAYARGVALAVAPWRRAPGNPLHRHKTLNYWESQMARATARRDGAFDALLLDPGGAVLEGGATNLFCVRRGAVLTPPLALGILPGVMRRFVVEICRGPLRLRVRETRLTLGDLLDADEVFVTNAVVGALPVSRVAGRPTRGGRAVAGEVTQRYRRVCGGGIARPWGRGRE